MQILLQFVAAVLQHCVVVAVFEEVVRQNYEQKDDEQVELKILIGTNQYNQNEQIFGGRCACEVVEEQQ